MKIILKEVEWFGLVSTLGGVIVFIAACSWDMWLGVSMNHYEGYGWRQILTMAVSGLYSMWALSIWDKWHGYQQKIHGMKK